ncbi:MAG: hypothetical protein Q8P99_02405 [bacterium]|nr:hypothetical protein [bacterium]
MCFWRAVVHLIPHNPEASYFVARLLRVEGDEHSLENGEYPLIDVPKGQLVSTTDFHTGEVRVRPPKPKEISPFDEGDVLWVVFDGDHTLGWETMGNREITISKGGLPYPETHGGRDW